MIIKNNNGKNTSQIEVTPIGKVSHLIGKKRIHTLCAIVGNRKKYAIITKADLSIWENAESKTEKQQLFVKYFSFNNLKNLKISPENFETQSKLSL